MKTILSTGSETTKLKELPSAVKPPVPDVLTIRLSVIVHAPVESAGSKLPKLEESILIGAPAKSAETST